MSGVALGREFTRDASFGGKFRSTVKTVRVFCRRYPLGAFGAVVILILLFLAAFPSLIATHHYEAFDVAARLQGPSSDHWLGTDRLGRDVFSRVIYGAQTSVIIGFGSVIVASVVSTILGVTSAYFGSWVDLLFQRLIDIWQAFPGLIFVVFVVSIFGNSELTIIITLAVIFSAGSSRVIRGSALTVLNRPFVEAARATGSGGGRIIWRHIVPNVLPIVIINASVQIGAVILIESSLSFLGFGIPPPFPSWGRMLQQAQTLMYHEPLLAIVPGFAIAITVYAFNLLGDALRDALDPRLKGGRP